MPVEVPPNPMTEEARFQVVGRAIYVTTFLLATAAFIFGIYSNAHCNFVGREIDLQPNISRTQACEDLGLGLQYQSLCDTILDEHGVGFYGWMGTVPVDQEICFSYTLWNPVVEGYITPHFDTKFNTAKALAVAANVFGALAFFTFVFSSCCPIEQTRIRGMACYFLIACLFQGLTLLIFRSEICQEAFFRQYFPQQDFEGAVESVDCVLGRGSRLAIASCVFYFVSAGLVTQAIAPMPLGYRPWAEEVPYSRSWWWDRRTANDETGNAPQVAARDEPRRQEA